MIAVTQNPIDISSILTSSQDSSAGATAICIDGCDCHHILRIHGYEKSNRILAALWLLGIALSKSLTDLMICT